MPIIWSTHILPKDGSGTISVIPHTVTAGSFATMAIRYTAATPILPGGRISIALGHGSDWGHLQTINPQAANYLTVTGPGGPGNYAVTVSWNDPPGPFDKHVYVSIRERPIQPGESVWMILGDRSRGAPGTRVQTYAQQQARLHVEVDADGDGAFQAITEMPLFDVVPGTASALIVTAPTDVDVGVPFSLQVRAEDAYGNLVSSYAGVLSLQTEPPRTRPFPKITLRSGAGGINWVTGVTLETPGIYRLQVSDGQLAGTSNPILVSATPEPCKHFWGDLHGHSQLSDGLGTPESYFRHGRDVAALDFLALSDHMNLTPEQWTTVESLTARFYEPGRFVTFPAYELSWPFPIGHHNVYMKEEGLAPFSTWQYPQLADYLRGHDAIAIQHHTAKMAGRMSTDWSRFLGDLEPLVEIYSGHGNSEYATAPRAVDQADNVGSVQRALSLGYRMGIIASTDNHDSHPGTSRWYRGYKGALVAVCAPELTRDAIWNALLRRQTYGTTGQRILLRFGVDGHPMGSELTVPPDAHPTFTVHVVGTADLAQVQLFKGRVGSSVPFPAMDLLSRASNRRPDPTQLFWTGPDPHGFDGSAFYYVRVVQKDGEMAWSSPIWIDVSTS